MDSKHWSFEAEQFRSRSAATAEQGQNLADGTASVFCQHAETSKTFGWKVVCSRVIVPIVFLNQGSFGGSGVASCVAARVEMACVVAP